MSRSKTLYNKALVNSRGFYKKSVVRAASLAAICILIESIAREKKKKNKSLSPNPWSREVYKALKAPVFQLAPVVMSRRSSFFDLAR